MDTNALSQAITDISPFNCTAGADYVEVSDQEGIALDNIVSVNGTATWGPLDEFSYPDEDVQVLAAAIVHTLKDAL